MKALGGKRMAVTVLGALTLVLWALETGRTPVDWVSLTLPSLLVHLSSVTSLRRNRVSSSRLQD